MLKVNVFIFSEVSHPLKSLFNLCNVAFFVGTTVISRDFEAVFCINFSFSLEKINALRKC